MNNTTDSKLQYAEEERIGDILERIRQEETPAVKGRKFEDLFMTVARELPEFQVEKIWSWQDWPDRQAAGLNAVDMGVDLVAHLVSGEKVAIQCKCYGENNKVSKRDVEAFIAASEGLGFDLRWVVATSDYEKGAEAFISNQPFNPEVRRIDFLEYQDQTIQGIKAIRQEKRSPYDLQERAISNVVRGFKEEKHERGRLVMACGTGKTFVSLQAAERLVPSKGLILFAAPTISLVSQARAEWLTHTRRPMNAFVVCSDRTAGGRASRDRGYAPSIDDLTCPVVTKPDALAEKLLDSPQNGVRAVFVTYHSLPTIIKAQTEHGMPAFDLAIADEAHRTTGVDTKAAEKMSFQHFHERIEANKRLYMTATQRIYKEGSKTRATNMGLEVVDMGDVDIYGPLLDQVKFKEGVAAGRLSDYRVIVLGVDESYLTPALREALTGADPKTKVQETDLLRLYGTALALNGYVQGASRNEPLRLQRTLAFATTNLRSRWYADTLKENKSLRSQITRRLEGDARSMKVFAQALDNSHSALERRQALDWLNDAPKANESRMICNVRLFAEGVDVPALDAVAFLDPKASQIDIVQAVGRVMRKAPDKKYGYVIVPVAMAGGDNLLDTLEKREDGYRVVGQVLRALQSHDERLAEQAGQFVIAYETRPNNQAPVSRLDDSADEAVHGGASSKEVQISLDLQPVPADSIYAQLVSMSGLESPGQATATNIVHTVQAAAGYFAEDADLLNNAGAVLDAPPPQNNKARKEIATLAALLIANACLLHKRLRSAVGGLAGLVDLGEISSSREPVPALLDAWKQVLTRDYEPIFRPALALLEKLPRTEATARAIRAIAECANAQADTLNELGYDHAGPLYHRILGNAESDGAFYTNNISALMLAGLALSPDLANWSDTDAVAGLRILDPACGTGTLLMAALKTIKDRAAAANLGAELSATQQAALHKRLVENSIMGLDINYQATQLAASNLTLGAPSVDYAAMHIHTMKHGPQSKGEVALGSLELLPTALEGVSPDLFGHTKQTGDAALNRGAKQSLDLKDIDVILMNPPFTNNKKRAAKFGPAEKSQMQDRQSLLKGHVETAIPDAAGVIDSNNGDTFFTPLADVLLRLDKGVLSQVLPTAALTAASGIARRRFLAARFHIDFIVTCHEHGKPNFSVKTAINESLLVCRRRQPGDADKPTRFIALNHMPRFADEVADWLEAVHAGQPHEFHQVFEWERERIAAGDWTPAQFYDGGLAEAARELAGHFSLAPLEEIAVLGPPVQAVNPKFENPLKIKEFAPPPKVRAGDAYPLVWRHQTNERRTMAATPEFVGEPKLGEEDYVARNLWPKASPLLLANNINTRTVRMSAIFLEESVLGCAWIPLRPKDSVPDAEAAMKMWCVFMNSTCGVLLLLNARARTLDWPFYNPQQFKSLSLPDPAKVDIQAIARVYDEMQHQELLRWSQMADDPVRIRLDDAVARLLDIDPKALADWRNRIAAEPTVRSRASA